MSAKAAPGCSRAYYLGPFEPEILDGVATAVQLDIRRDGAKVVVVAPSCGVDLATEGVLRLGLQEIGSCEVLVLDLWGVMLMDGAGVGVLEDERRGAEQEGSACVRCPGAIGCSECRRRRE